MNPKSLDAIILRYVGFGVLFVGMAVMLYLVRGVLPVFVVGGIIAYAVEPLLQRLELNGRSRPRAVAFMFGIYILLLLVLFSLLATAVQQGQSLIQPQTATKQFERVTQLVQTNQDKLKKLPLLPAVRDAVNNVIDSSIASATQSLQKSAPDLARNVTTATIGFLISVFLITLISFGLMLEAPQIKGRLLMMVPPIYRRDVTRLSASINELLGRYVRGQLIVCFTFGTLCTIAFEVLSRVYGMQYPLVLGALAAFIYILPYFGMAAVTISAGLIAYLTANPNQNVLCAAIAVGCCIGFNLFVDYGVAPRVLGRGVGLHPLMVIFALLCGFELSGPLGTIAAVPIFASLRVIFIYLFPQLTAPLPAASPEATSQGKSNSATSEMGERVARAEASVVDQPLLASSEKT